MSTAQRVGIALALLGGLAIPCSAGCSEEPLPETEAAPLPVTGAVRETTTETTQAPVDPVETPDETETVEAMDQPVPSEAEGQARECTMRGDNACVIRLLENGRADTPTALRMLIEAYRARGQTNTAVQHMRTFVTRYPTHAAARAYEQILARQ